MMLKKERNFLQVMLKNSRVKKAIKFLHRTLKRPLVRKVRNFLHVAFEHPISKKVRIFLKVMFRKTRKNVRVILKSAAAKRVRNFLRAVFKKTRKFLRVLLKNPIVKKARFFLQLILKKAKLSLQDHFPSLMAVKGRNILSVDSKNRPLSLELDSNNQHAEKLSSLDKSLHLEEAKPPHRSSLNILIITSILGGFILWAAVTPINEVAVASGQIIPSGFIKSVQHLEGGIISELYVKEGQKVKEGELLMRLDGKGFLSDLDQALSKQLSLRIKKERLRAIGLSQKPTFDSYGPGHKQLIEDQKAIYEMQMRNLNDQKMIVDKQVEQQKEQLQTQLGQEKDIRHRLEFVEKQRDVIKKLQETHLKTGSEYRNAEENVTVVQKELNEVINQMQKTKKGFIESEKRLIELETHMRVDALKEMGTTSAELEEVSETINKLKDRVSRLDIKAPNSGVVKGLKVTNLRAVIQQGEEIMQIVPGDAFEVEAKLNPKDTGNVKPNQKVTIKVEAYDYARYGAIEGTLKSVSASTFLNEEKRPYYKAFISLSQDYVGSNNMTNRVSPGMTVTADIHTGSKTLLQYLIRPIYNAYKSAFRER